MFPHKTNSFMGSIEDRMATALEIFKDPEYFLLNKYYKLQTPKGFRIEFYAAKRFNLFCANLKQFNKTFLKPENFINKMGKKPNIIADGKNKGTVVKRQEKRFCQYCEQIVIPKRTHKLDYGDIMLVFFTGGFWAFFLIALYLFMRRCPVCNYSLRGIKPIKNNQ